MYNYIKIGDIMSLFTMCVKACVTSEYFHKAKNNLFVLCLRLSNFAIKKVCIAIYDNVFIETDFANCKKASFLILPTQSANVA